MFGTNGIAASHIALTSYEIVLFRTLIGSLVRIAIFFHMDGYPVKAELPPIGIGGNLIGFPNSCYCILGERVTQMPH